MHQAKSWLMTALVVLVVLFIVEKVDFIRNIVKG